MMKSTLQYIFLAIACCMPIAWINAQVTPENCSEISAAQGWPSYYCDCKYGYLDFALPLDIEISDSTWFKASLSDLSQGLSAYLYSDCNMSFDVFVACTNEEPKYQKEFTSNQTNSIDGQTIKERLEEYGYADGTFYICIAPIYGFGGRLLVNTQDQGFHTSCDNPLYILPGMSLYSTNATDIYALSPNDIPYGEDVIIHWQGEDNTPSQLTITSYSCDGDLVDQLTLDASHPCYTFSAERIDQAWSDDEVFYLQFSHEPNTAGFVHCLTPEFTAVYHDTTICQGMGVQMEDTLLTETTTYLVDTVFLHTNQYRVNYLNVLVVEPETQPDTLAFKYSQQPYIYRGQHTISKPGNYDLTIHTPGACDERYALHVYHDIDTVVNVVDTFLCYGASYEHEGKKYLKNTSFAKTDWKNQDTLILDTLNVYFATTPDIVYDTIMQNQNKYGKTFKQTGDFNFTYTNPLTYCVDSIVLHVKPGSNDGITYDYYYIDTTLCQGMEYEDYYGNVYTESTVLYDTIPRVMNKLYEVEITTITFIEPEYLSDTLILAQGELPYIYRDTTIYSFGEYELEYYTEEGCLELAINLSVQEKKVTTNLEDTELYDRPRLILRDGVVYILRDSEVYTLLGEKIK